MLLSIRTCNFFTSFIYPDSKIIRIVNYFLYILIYINLRIKYYSYMDIKTSTYTFKDVDTINILLGKNGSGKSTLLRELQAELSTKGEYGLVTYITPERAGSLRND